MKEFKKAEPFFIVGVPRSGTTLLAAMLAAHSKLSCGTETRFFRFLSLVDTGKLIDPGHWPDSAAEFLFNMKLVDIPVPEHYGLEKEQIKAYLDTRAACIPTILSSLTEQFMLREGKERWVEKSPEHLLFVRDIRRHFPRSPIIRIVRDPRDVALSLNKAPWAPADFLDAILLWRKYDQASWKFFQDDQNSLTIQYEALLLSPEKELRKVCEFVGESFEPTMLDTSKSADHLVTKKDSWHRIVNKPVDISRIGVWKRELPEGGNRLVEALLGDRISAYGYECVEKFDSVAQVYPSPEILSDHRRAYAALVEKGIRFWTKWASENKKFTIYVGSPDNDNWLRHNKPGRWGDILRIIANIIWDKLSGRSVYWIRNSQVIEKHSGAATRLLAFTFKLAETKFDFADLDKGS
jgi:hypothetical protein